MFFSSQKGDIFPRSRLGEEYSGSEITFLRQAPNGDWIIFQSPDGKCVRKIISIKFFLQSETQKREVFKMIFRMKTFPLLNDRKSQIPWAKTLKQMEFSSNR